MEYSVDVVKQFVKANPKNEEACYMYLKLLNQLRSHNNAFVKEPYYRLEELRSVVEKLLDINPNDLSLILQWLEIQVEDSCLRTDMTRYNEYLKVLSKNEDLHFEELKYKIESAILEKEYSEIIKCCYEIIDVINIKFQNRLERDYYLSHYVFILVNNLSNTKVQTEAVKEIDFLLSQYSFRLTYDNTEPLFLFFSKAFADKNIELLEIVTKKIVSLLESKETFEKDKLDLGFYLLVEGILLSGFYSEGIVNLYLLLTEKLYGENRWDTKVEQLIISYPTSDYVKYSYGMLCFKRGNYQKAISFLEDTLFKPFVFTKGLGSCIEAYYKINNTIPELLDVLEMEETLEYSPAITLTNSALEIQKFRNKLNDKDVCDKLDALGLSLCKKAIEIIDNYVEFKMYSSSELMNKANIAKAYYNYCVYVYSLDNLKEMDKALIYAHRSKEFLFLPSQDEIYCLLLMRLEKNEEALDFLRHVLNNVPVENYMGYYLEYRLYEIMLLERLGLKDESHQAYVDMRSDLFPFLEKYGDYDCINVNFELLYEVDDLIASHSKEKGKFLFSVAKENYEFFDGEEDVLLRLCKICFTNGMIEEYIGYGKKYIKTCEKNDCFLSNDFLNFMKVFLPELYKTEPTEVKMWLKLLRKEKCDASWVDNYCVLYLPNNTISNIK